MYQGILKYGDFCNCERVALDDPLPMQEINATEASLLTSP